MKHGQERNRHIERTLDTFSGQTPNGEAVEVCYCDSELTVSERFCGNCNEWVSTKGGGLLGHCGVVMPGSLGRISSPTISAVVRAATRSTIQEREPLIGTPTSPRWRQIASRCRTLC